MMQGNFRAVLLGAGIMLAAGGSAYGQSAGAKNKEGNRLFAQGKYQDAEKAYLDAQADLPGRPELSYNLGNTLIKQNKYGQALDTLRRAVAKGDKELQARAWYNAGNALYDMGEFKNSAQAYIEDLQLNPSDADAKHNLELSLRKMQKQEQQNQGQNSDQQNRQGSDQNDKNKDSKNQNQPGHNSQPQDSRAQSAEKTQSSPPDRAQGAITREQALQILDAFKNQELAERRRLLEQQAHRKPSARDW